MFSSKKIQFALFLLLILAMACQPKNRYGDMFTYSKKTGKLNVVIEVTAGTNKLFEYDYESNLFRIKKINGKDKLLEYLPPPFNIGFIPSTTTIPKQMMPLRCFLISDEYSTSTMIDSKPIAVLSYTQDSVTKEIILVVPDAVSLRSINVNSLSELQTKYPSVLQIIKEWFSNYDNTKAISNLEFKDEVIAKELIEKYRIK